MNVCVVGYGAIGPVHAQALSQIEGVTLYGICDIDRERADQGAEQYHCHAFYDFDVCLNEKEIDSIHICTPHYLHFEMIEKCVAAGKMVVVEKPVVMKRDELIAVQKYCGSRVFPVLQNRINRCVAEMKRIIDTEPAIGGLKAIKGIVTWDRDAAYYNSAEWRGTKEFEGGGVLINQALHTLDLMIYLGGRVETIHATGSNHSLRDVIEVEDTMDAFLRYENGAKGIFYATNAYGDNSSVQLELKFEQVTLRYIDGKLYRDGEKICEDDNTFLGKSYWGSGHAKLLHDIYVKHTPILLEDVTDTMRTMFALYESAETQKEVRL